jgi:hypothetical protein
MLGHCRICKEEHSEIDSGFNDSGTEDLWLFHRYTPGINRNAGLVYPGVQGFKDYYL